MPTMGQLKLKSYSLGGVCISVGVLRCLPWAVAGMASSPQLGGVCWSIRFGQVVPSLFHIVPRYISRLLAILVPYWFDP
jgi:hypothetical protein